MMQNPLDVQKLIQVLIDDVQMAIAAEHSDYEYDAYLSHGELSEYEEAAHERALKHLDDLKRELTWYQGAEPKYDKLKPRAK